MPLLDQIERCLQRRPEADILLSTLHKRDVKLFATRAESLLENKALWQLTPLCDRGLSGVCKDPSETRRFKDAAGEAFKQGAFKEAAETYSRSLRHAPTTDDAEEKLVGTILANRALCCLKLRQLRQTGEEEWCKFGPRFQEILYEKYPNLSSKDAEWMFCCS